MSFRNPTGAHRQAGIPLSGVRWNDQHIQDDDVSGVIFQDCVFERVHLERSALQETVFVGCRFDDCTFDDCRIVDTRWVDCTGSGLRISGGELIRAVITQCHLSRLTLAQTGDRILFSDSTVDRFTLDRAGCEQDSPTFSECTFGAFEAQNARWRLGSAVGVDFGVWAMDNAHFEQCSFVRAIGNATDFSRVRFKSCNLYQSDFSECRFLYAEGSIFAECELAGASFEEAALEGALFAKSRAAGANFERSRLDRALFPKAVLTGASFRGASARQSVWMDADLTGATLEGVDAFRATFRHAVLDDTKVANASFVEADLHGVEATLDGADLRGARGTVDWRAEREAQARS